MKSSVSALLMLAALSMCAAETKPFAPETTIWFDAPATNFTESTTLGNGRLGAMMFCGVNEERIVLNESSVWSGSRQDSDRPDACKYLSEIRQLLREGKNVQSEARVNAYFTGKGPGSSGGSGDAQYCCYQVPGNLHLSFPGNTNALIANYRRARLDDGNYARLMVQKALNPAFDLSVRLNGGGGVYPNLPDTCPPFQLTETSAPRQPFRRC